MDIEGESDGDFEPEESSGEMLFGEMEHDMELEDLPSEPEDADDAAAVERTMAALFPEPVPPPTRPNVYDLLNDPFVGWIARKKALVRHPLFLGKMTEAYQWEGHEGCVNTLNYNPSGSLLASGSDDRTVILWREDGSMASRLRPGHLANVFCAQFRNGSEQIVSCDRVRLCSVSITFMF